MYIYLYLHYTPWNMETKIHTRFRHRIIGVAERGAGSGKSTRGLHLYLTCVISLKKQRQYGTVLRFKNATLSAVGFLYLFIFAVCLTCTKCSMEYGQLWAETVVVGDRATLERDDCVGVKQLKASLILQIFLGRRHSPPSWEWNISRIQGGCKSNDQIGGIWGGCEVKGAWTWVGNKNILFKKKDLILFLGKK